MGDGFHFWFSSSESAITEFLNASMFYSVLYLASRIILSLNSTSLFLSLRETTQTIKKGLINKQPKKVRNPPISLSLPITQTVMKKTKYGITTKKSHSPAIPAKAPKIISDSSIIQMFVEKDKKQKQCQMNGKRHFYYEFG